MYHKTINSLARQLRLKDLNTRKALKLLQDVKHFKSDHVHLVRATSRSLERCSKLDGETKVLVATVQLLWARFVKARYVADVEKIRQPMLKGKKSQGTKEGLKDRAASTSDDEDVETYFSADEEEASVGGVAVATTSSSSSSLSSSSSNETEAVSLDEKAGFGSLTEYLNSKCGENSPTPSSDNSKPGTSETDRTEAVAEEKDSEKDSGEIESGLKASPAGPSAVPEPCALLKEENDSMRETIRARDREIDRLQEQLTAAKADVLASQRLSGEQRDRLERSFVRLACKSGTKIRLLQQRISAAEGKNKALSEKVRALEKKVQDMEELKKGNEQLHLQLTTSKEESSWCREQSFNVARSLKAKQSENENLKTWLTKLEGSLMQIAGDGKNTPSPSSAKSEVACNTVPKLVNRSGAAQQNNISREGDRHSNTSSSTRSSPSKIKLQQTNSLSKNIWLNGILD